MKNHEAWPALPYAEWAPTKKTLHMVAQMLGKARLALAPPQPEWLHACLYLDGRGFTTGAMPFGTAVVSIGIDVYDVAIRIDVSDGRRATVPLAPNRCVADIWADFRAALDGLGIDADIWEQPQELADTTPFSENRHDARLEPGHAQRFHRVLCGIDGVFEEFRSSFFGRSGVQFWWGSFDFCVLLFTGRHLTAPDHRGYIMRYDLDAEQLNAGFWPGDDSTPDARLYAYVVPRPDGCEVAPIEPALAAWAEAMGEWVLPYEDVRTSEDPRAAILEFLNSVYRVAVTNGGWSPEAYRYVTPTPAPRA
ncbi:MAG: DUF5996 family protein [Candidatus Limnocylindrales bacterium]